MRVPADALLGGEGQAFAIAQTRLGGGRIHHAMRTIGLAQKALDMMCERALSRETPGSLLADKQFVQGYIADSYAQLIQFRLFVLYVAWEIDKYNDYRGVRKDIATVKVLMPDGAPRHRLAGHAGPRRARRHQRDALRSDDRTAQASWAWPTGPTEVHKVTVARQVLRDHAPTDDMWPTQHIPEAPGGGAAEVRGGPRARGREPVSAPRTSTPTASPTSTSWRPGSTPRGSASAQPSSISFISGGSQNEIYEIRRGDLHCALRDPAADGSRDARRRASCASGASSRRSAGPTCRTPRPSPSAATRPCSAAPST